LVIWIIYCDQKKSVASVAGDMDEKRQILVMTETQ